MDSQILEDVFFSIIFNAWKIDPAQFWDRNDFIWWSNFLASWKISQIYFNQLSFFVFHFFFFIHSSLLFFFVSLYKRSIQLKSETKPILFDSQIFWIHRKYLK